MRKITAILIATAMACAFAPLVGAGTTDTIVVTLSPSATASISVDQSIWSPVCKLGETNSTSATWATITNNGDINVRVDINASNTESWTIAGSAGHDQFKLETLGIALTLTASPQTFIANLPSDGGNTAQFGLKVTMPTTSSSSNTQHLTITFTATAL